MNIMMIKMLFKLIKTVNEKSFFMQEKLKNTEITLF